MTAPYPAPFDTGLTDAQRERLACLAEEAAEIVQAVGKILRHGYDSRYHDGTTNTAALEREIGDLTYVVDCMSLAGDVDAGAIDAAREAKVPRFRKYTHYQPASEDWRPGGTGR